MDNVPQLDSEQGVDPVLQGAQTVLPVTPIPQKEEDENQSFSDFVIDADFDDDEVDEVMKLITQQMTIIKGEYDEIGWFKSCDDNDDEYEGTHTDDLNTTDDDDYVKMLLTTTTIDIIAYTAQRQLWQANPSVTMEAQFEDIDQEDILNKRQDYLDYDVRNKSKLMDSTLPLFQAACKHGVAILKPFYEHNEESRTQNKKYTKDNIQDFRKKYGKKILKGSGKEFDEEQSLMRGETVTKKETDDVVTYHGAKMYRVDPRRFFARPKIKYFNKHVVISEMFTYNSVEIESMMNSGFWDKDKITELMEEEGDEFYRKDHDFFTTIVQYDRKKNGKPERYLVTHEKRTKKIARAIHYPYKSIFYIPCCVMEKDDSWIGYSITDRMADIVATVNAVINSYIREEDLAKTPMIVSNGTQVGDWNIRIGKVNLLPLGLGNNMQGQQTQFMQPQLMNVSTDRIAFLNWLMSYVAILTGVDPYLQSGAPNPQGGKKDGHQTQQMKLQSSHTRIEDMVVTLFKAVAQAFEQIEYILYKFPENAEDKAAYFKNGKKQQIDPKFFERPVGYMVAGSSMSFDKNIDLQVIMGTMNTWKQFFPAQFQGIDAMELFAKAILNSSPGTMSKLRDQLLKPFEDQKKVVKQKQEQMQKTILDIKAAGKAKGLTDSQIDQFISQMFSGGGKPAMPGQGGPQPGQAPTPQPPQQGGMNV